LSKIHDKSYIYLQNSFVNEAEAAISVRDRGFRFGDGVFETVRIHNGTPYQLNLHINRLKQSLALVKISYNLKAIPDICKQLIKKNNLKNGFLRIAISRGEGSRGYLPDIKGGASLVIETMPAIPQIYQPVDLYLSSYRKIPKDCLPPAAKTMQGLNPTLARMEAQENQCFEALLLNNAGNICEGSSSNIFWFKDNKLYTPSLDIEVLPGTMRDAVIRLSPYEIVEGIFGLDDLPGAEEVFVTNSAWLVVAVETIRDKSTRINFKNFNISNEIRQILLQDIENHAA
jgi:branched-chain amino acid aminotransferase